MDPPNNNFSTHYLRNLFSLFTRQSTTPSNYSIPTTEVWTSTEQSLFGTASPGFPNGFSVRSVYYFFRRQKLRNLIISFTVHMKWGLCGCDYDQHVCKGVWITWSEVITTIRSNVNWSIQPSREDSHTFKCQPLGHWFIFNLWGVWNEYWQLVWFVFGKWMKMNERHFLS